MKEIDFLGGQISCSFSMFIKNGTSKNDRDFKFLHSLIYLSYFHPHYFLDVKFI